MSRRAYLIACALTMIPVMAGIGWVLHRLLEWSNWTIVPWGIACLAIGFLIDRHDRKKRIREAQLEAQVAGWLRPQSPEPSDGEPGVGQRSGPPAA